MSTPRWLWDLLADLVDYENEHGPDAPCVGTTLHRVPADTLSAARVIAEYRRGQSVEPAPNQDVDGVAEEVRA